MDPACRGNRALQWLEVVHYVCMRNHRDLPAVGGSWTMSNRTLFPPPYWESWPGTRIGGLLYVGVVACAWCKKKFCASCRSFSFVGYAYSTPGDFICYKCHPHDCSPPCRPKRSRSTFHGPIPKALRDFNGAGAKDDTAADKAALTRKRERAPTRRFAEYLIADH